MGQTKDDGNSQKSNQVASPDPKKHFQISMIKSAIRIAAGLALVYPQSQNIVLAGVLIVIAEILGIVEEMV